MKPIPVLMAFDELRRACKAQVSATHYVSMALERIAELEAKFDEWEAEQEAEEAE